MVFGDLKKWIPAIVLGTLLLAGVWSWSTDGIVAVVSSHELSSADKLQSVREYFLSFGLAAPLVYVLFVTVEVIVAPIPGAILYAPGGVIFGAYWGGLLSLVGNVVGAGIACWAMRTMFGEAATRYVDAHALQKYERRLANSGLWVILLLRLNPLTSSDLVSYAAGLTSIPVWKVMLATAIGMAPLCWTQAWIADELLTVFPRLLYPLIVACVIYLVVVVYVLRRLARETV